MPAVKLIGSYNYALVALSVLIAMFASYAALHLAGRVTAAAGWTRAVWLLGGAGAMGTGIWSMHYIGMLAFILPIPVAYHWPTVLLSLFAAILASLVALGVVSRQRMGWSRALAGSVLMGAGIAGMHYIGMAAMRLAAICQFNSFLVVLSVVFAVLISLAALWITFHFRDEKTGIGWEKLAGTAVMGAAIPVMHYTGMAAASFTPFDKPTDLSHAISISTLGIAGIVGVTFLVLGLALLTSLVDRRLAAQTLEVQEEKLQQSEAYLAEAQRLSHTGSFGWKPSTGELIWSEETFRIFQYDRLTKPTTELVLQRVHPEDAALVRQTIERASQDGKDFDFEHRLLMPDGSVKHVHVVAHAERGASGELEFVGAVMDITERKQAEEAVRRSEGYLAEAQRLSHTGSWASIPATGEIKYFSEECYRVLGFDPHGGQPRYEAFFQRVHPDDQAKLSEAVEKAGRDKTEFELDYRFIPPSGERRDIHVIGHPVLSPSSDLVEFVGTVMDVTERKRAEEALRMAMSERTRLAAVRGEVGMALARQDDLRGILHVCAEAMVRHLNAAFARIWTFNSEARELELQASAGRYTRLDGRYSRIPLGEIKIGLIAQERKPYLTNDVQNDPRISDKDWARAEKVTAFAGYPLAVEDRVVGVMAMFSAKPLTENTLDTLSFIADGIAQGIERKRAEEALRQSEGYLAEAQRLSHTGSWARVAATGEMRYWSEECYRVLGFEPHGGLPRFETFLQRVHPDDQAKVRETAEIARREKVDYELNYRIVLPGGDVRDIHVVGHPVFRPSGDLVEFVGTVMDVTERKLAEEERERLRQAQADLAHVNRVTTMGELTASVAHEVNQPIAAAVTNAKSCLRWLTRDHPDVVEARAAAMRIVNDGTRAAEIISRTRQLFKKDSSQRELVDINEIIQEMTVLLRGEITRFNILVETDLAADLPKVMADRVQLQQVLMNLVINGIEAMKDEDGPRELAIRSQRAENEKLLVSVSDTGIGLPPQRTDQIFNSFFTTKPHGTGMGLRISRSIVESHGGRLWAENNSQRGASFCFSLPTKAGAPE